ncbi:MAG: RNA polymerase sigma factor [Eubacteriaceae bacterium]|nr:RNA polymerase sigma factor [Eubacteriaceae bacterium]
MAEEALLAAKARDGDMGAFGELYSIVYKDLYKYALYSLRNPDEAEDAVSDCISEAIKGIKGLRDESLFRKWIFTILYRTVKKRFKARYNSAVSIESFPFEITGDEGFDEGLAEAVSVYSELSKLSADERQIVLLSVVGGYSGLEIAQMAKMPHGTVRSKLSRALAKLRGALSDDTGGKN